MDAFPKTGLFLTLLAAPCIGRAGPGPWSGGMDVTSEAAFGLEGGAHTGGTLHGIALAHAGWARTHDDPATISVDFYMSVLGVAGRGPTERLFGDYLALSNIEAYQSVRLYSWWFELGQEDWSLRAGALLADEEFTGTDAGGNLLNSAFGWPVFISANTVNTGPAFYVAAPGIRFERKWHEGAAWRLGVFDGDSFDSPVGDPYPTRHGMHYGLGGSQGWFLISEETLSTPGGGATFKVGAWYHTARFDDVLEDANGVPFATSGNGPRVHDSNHGFYASAEFTLAGKRGEPGSVAGWFRGGIAPADRNAVSHAIDAGIAWNGPIPGRSADVLTLGTARAWFSGGYARSALLADPSGPAPDFEQAVEACYTIQLSERLSIQPDLQYILHPGGSRALPNAFAFRLRVNASFP